MNKISQKYNHDIDNFNDDLRKNIEVFSLKESEIQQFLNLKRAALPIVGDEKIDNFIKSAWKNKETISKLQNKNDFYFFIISMMISKNSLKKVAYPMAENYFFKTPFYGYDLQSWATCVHKIYDSVYKDGTSYDDALNKYSSNIFKDKEEKDSFLNWIKYYNHGEHLKYNVKNASIKKDAAFSLIGDPYASTSNYIGNDYDLDHDKQENDAKTQSEGKINYKNWKKKFNTALRRVDKILKESEDYVDSEKYEEISQVLNKLDVQVQKIRLQVSASDISFCAAGKLKKLGFSNGADVLFKYAQDAAPVDAADPKLAPVESPEKPDASDVPASTEPVGPSPEEIARKNQDKQNVDKGKTLMRDIDPVPGAEEGEYDAIMKKDVSIEDAARKLEQIAGALSDRRVIRYLSEFDIILDKVGIASMFPELAEAQSKLIESYGYALTRVTKMLGMLSNSKAIQDMSGSVPVPGTEDESAETTETPVTPEDNENIETEQPNAPIDNEPVLPAV